MMRGRRRRSAPKESSRATLLAGRELWRATTTALRKARRAWAALAYLGQGGGQLLPVRKGSTLVVDMSLRAVKAGATDPKEVRKLLRRGVEVFTRGSLHAKAFVTERVAIVGSANASHRSRDYLDEVAVLVKDEAVRRDLRSVIESYCTEPVRAEYLKRCLKAYRPPRGGAGGGPEAPGSRLLIPSSGFWVASRGSTSPRRSRRRYGRWKSKQRGDSAP